MTSLFLMGVIGLWIGLLAYLASLIGRRVRSPYGPLLASVMFLILLPMPIIDEVIGKQQFETLCRNNATEFRKGVSDLEGRTARVVIAPSNERIPGVAIPIYHSHVMYRDVKTGEVILEFDRYQAKGGFAIQSLGISEGNSPLLIGSPACSPKQERGEAAHRTFNFVIMK